VRGKALSSWNKKSPSVKLAAAHDRRELVVEFLVPSKITFADLSAVGLAISNAFAIAMNVATRGFFWWYLPAKRERFFEEIRDLERNEPLAIRHLTLDFNWGKHSLSEMDLEEVMRVYRYLQRIPAERSEPYAAYLQGLALISKNDLHGRFEPAILLSFYQALRALIAQHGDWDGSSPFVEAVKKSLDIFRERIDSIDRELPRTLDLGEMLMKGKLVPDLNLRDTIMMKIYCDLTISRMAHEALGFRPIKKDAESASTDMPDAAE
jgi:hypothetical protein